MIVHVNGQATEMAAGSTVESVVAELAPERRERGIAVAVDAEVVPRRDWRSRRLEAGSRVEIVAAIQGG